MINEKITAILTDTQSKRTQVWQTWISYSQRQSFNQSLLSIKHWQALVPPGIPLPFFLLSPHDFLFTSFLFFIVHIPMSSVAVLLTKCYCTLLLINSKVHEVKDVRRQLLTGRWSILALQSDLGFRVPGDLQGCEASTGGAIYFY